MGRYKSKNPTVSKGFSMKPDILEMLKEQSDEAGLTMSGYIERLILEKDIEKAVYGTCVNTCSVRKIGNAVKCSVYYAVSVYQNKLICHYFLLSEMPYEK